MPARKYSTTDIEMICALRDRLSASEIAPTFGTTRNAIISVWRRNMHLCRPVSRLQSIERQSRVLTARHLAPRFEP